MHLTKELTGSLSLFHDDYEWVQTLDYEHIPFCCRNYHEHGHLFKDFPLNLQSKISASETNKDVEGFTKVPSHRKQTKKPPIAPANPKKLETRNNFGILSSPSLMEDHALILPPDLSSSSPLPKSAQFSTPASTSTDKHLASDLAIPSSDMEIDASLAQIITQRSDEEDWDKPSFIEEGPENEDIGGLDLLKLEAACRQKDFSEIPLREIDKLEGVLIKAQQNKYLGIQAGSPWDGKNILKDTKKRGRKTDLQRTIIIG